MGEREKGSQKAVAAGATAGLAPLLVPLLAVIGLPEETLLPTAMAISAVLSSLITWLVRNR